ncbi:MAG: nodulation efficiency protein D (NfeD) [Bacteroidales bacterium]|jgi:membrane-bound ClpP family serine protease|nr:nodulation efficiency protein D (NfeD) [Bacteroidales bacterium]
MEILWILLLVVGFILILVEILVVPGMSIVGIFGFSALIYGVVRIFVDYGTTAGWIALASVLAVCIILVVWFMKTKSWKKIMLHDKLEDKVNVVDQHKIKVGDEGTAMSRLAPMGQATFADEIYEVHSMDGFIDQKTPIKVVKIENSKIFVVGL